MAHLWNCIASGTFGSCASQRIYDRILIFEALNGRYFVCNDLSHSLDKANPNSYRDTVIACELTVTICRCL